MPATQKAYRGIAMEGPIASWYAKNTGRDLRRFEDAERAIAERLPAPARILEVAPGPGYLAIALARRGHEVAAVDISRSFVRIVGENASKAGVAIDVRHGDAAAIPFPDGSFDYVVCMAAFKNFTDPARALDEMYRVLRPGGQASICDLRRDAVPEEVEAEVQNMGLSAVNAFITRWTFRHMLLSSAYTVEQIERLAHDSRFAGGTVAAKGIGFELRLLKPPLGAEATSRSRPS